MKRSALKKLSTYLYLIPMKEDGTPAISYSGLQHHIHAKRIKTVNIDGVTHIDSIRYPPEIIMDIIRIEQEKERVNKIGKKLTWKDEPF